MWIIIRVDTNLKTLDFLNVTFDLDKNLYKPYQKPNNSPIYINKNSNHPPNILKQLPKSIAKCTSETSSSEKIFNKSIKIYSDAPKYSGFTDELRYLPNEAQQLENNDGKKRKRKLIWFNPAYSKNVKTNVGKVFLKLLKKYFPASHILHNIFNKTLQKIVTVA